LKPSKEEEDIVSNNLSPKISEEPTETLLHASQSLSHEFGTPLNLITTLSDEGYNDPNISTQIKE
jgi:hypothetical protein